MDIYQRIKDDHDQARDIIKRLKETTDQASKTRRELFDELKRDLWVHHKLEEAVLYEVLRKEKETRGDSLEAINEHHMANAMLEALDSMPVDNAQWSAKFGALAELVEHHMEEEEDETFEEARKVLDAAVAEELGSRFDDRKKVIVAALEPVDLRASA